MNHHYKNYRSRKPQAHREVAHTQILLWELLTKDILIVAILMRLSDPAVIVPESGYSITYNSLPESDEEEAARHARHEARVRLGLASRVSLMMDENPGMDRAAAETELALLDADNMRFPPPAPKPAGGFGT